MLTCTTDRVRCSADERRAESRVEKGIIRYLYLIVDKSNAMQAADLTPTRARVTEELVRAAAARPGRLPARPRLRSRRTARSAQVSVFVKEFFDQNPISHLGIIVAHNKVADRVTELSGNPQHQIDSFLRSPLAGGEFSLQNSLTAAKAYLQCVFEDPRWRLCLIVCSCMRACVQAGANVRQPRDPAHHGCAEHCGPGRHPRDAGRAAAPPHPLLGRVAVRGALHCAASHAGHGRCGLCSPPRPAVHTRWSQARTRSPPTDGTTRTC